MVMYLVGLWAPVPFKAALVIPLLGALLMRDSATLLRIVIGGLAVFGLVATLLIGPDSLQVQMSPVEGNASVED
jgi:hypothetical protein